MVTTSRNTHHLVTWTRVRTKNNSQWLMVMELSVIVGPLHLANSALKVEVK